MCVCVCVCVCGCVCVDLVDNAGQGTERDQARAADLFSQLAMKGHPYAQLALGGMYYTGSGLEQNFTRAYSLYKVLQATPIFCTLCVCVAGGITELCGGGLQLAR